MIGGVFGVCRKQGNNGSIEVFQQCGDWEPEPVLIGAGCDWFVEFGGHKLAVEEQFRASGSDIESNADGGCFGEAGRGVEAAEKCERAVFLLVRGALGSRESDAMFGRGVLGSIRQEPRVTESDGMNRHFGKFGRGMGRVPGASGEVAPI